MIVIKAPAGFDPTWPALPVDPTCAHAEEAGDASGSCPACIDGVLDLAALLGPKDCECLGTGVSHVAASGICTACGADGKVPQRVALAIETPCERCHGTGTAQLSTMGRKHPARCPDCDVSGVRRLWVEYTCLVARIERDGDRWMVYLEDVAPVAPTLIGHFEGITEMEASWLPVS